MKCVCKKTCQVRVKGKIKTFSRGQVADFEKVPKGFTSLEPAKGEEKSHVVDFTKASEEELQNATWTFEEAFKAIKNGFDIELKREEGTKKSDVVAQILDARYRQID